MYGMGYRTTVGTARAANGSSDQTLLAAPGGDNSLGILNITIMVNVAAAGGGGEVLVQNGIDGTNIVRADADAVGVFNVRFDPPGYILSENTALVLAVEGAATTQATVDANAQAIVHGG